MPLKNELARNTSTCLGIRGPTANVHNDFVLYVCADESCYVYGDAHFTLSTINQHLWLAYVHTSTVMIYIIVNKPKFL